MKIKIVRGDITRVEADVIVNAANTSLMGGGGVDGAIHRAGGPKILEECRQIRNRQGGCKTGEAVITTAGNLPAQKVIHTVGPVWNKGNETEKQLLRNCYLNSLRLAEENGFSMIAFPNISTGIYKFPKQEACEIAIEVINSYQSEVIREVIFVCFDEENHRLYTDRIKN